MIWIGLLLSLVSCKDTMEAIGLGGDEIPAEGVTLNIELPNFSEKQVGTRAGTTESINSIKAVFYDKSNNYIDMADATFGSLDGAGKYKVTISKIPSGTTTVHLVTNVSDLTKAEAEDLQGIASATSRTIDTNSPVCWGSVSLKTLLDGTANVFLLRQYAKVTLKVDKAVQGNFPEKDAGLIINHTAAKSAIAPAGYNEPADDLAATTDFSSTDVGGGTRREVVVTETSAGVANVIIKAKYKDVEGYYKVGLYKDKDATKKTQYALLRNHHYTITVTKVNDYGFKTKEEAIKAEPENRLEAEIIDDNPAITKMIACKDYELGVSDDLSVKATAAVATEEITATITLVTTLSSATSADGKLYGVSINPADSWITFKDKDVTETTLPESGSKSSSGMKYVLTFKLAPNYKSEDPRTGTVTISSGDLKLDVKITQAGFDFRRDDPMRRVIMYDDSSSPVTENYFTWLDETMQGIKPSQMQGIVRNDGLHFAVGNNTYSYKIPKLEGDTRTNNNSRFTVSDDGGYWKVTLNNNTNNFDLWKDSLTITNKEGIKITYYVYHTGIFHKITEEMATKYELAEGGDESLKVKGWFYYGVVKVQGQKKTYIMLDRNLGATDNSRYAPDINELKAHKGAIGGYFKISEDKNTSEPKKGNLSSTLSPEGFKIPDRFVFEDLIAQGTLKTEKCHTALGESYYSTYMETKDSELKTIYLPYGGYLEGLSHKNPNHMILWTKSLLSGTQGFSEDSNEFGYWYNYFDVYNDKKGISNVRFVSGSNGNNTGRYKAMPLRLISKKVL